MSIDMQKQIRDNATDVSTYMKDLYEWTEDMNIADARRSKLAPTKTFVPPPRGKVEEDAKPKRKDAEKKEKKPAQPIKRDGKKIKEYYADWDRYDVEKEEEKLEDPSKPRTPNPERFETRSNARPNAQIRVRTGARPKASMQIAQDLKEEANRFFSASKWFDACEHYGKALAYVEPIAEAGMSADADHPVDPEATTLASVLFANRALVHLKRTDYRLALEDCDRALTFAPGSVKPLFRRGTALAKMKRWEDARADLMQVVEQSPDDKKARAELEYVQRMFDTELNRRRERAAKLISDKSRKPKLPMRRLPIAVSGAAQPKPSEEPAPEVVAEKSEVPPETRTPEPEKKPRPKYIPKSVRMAQRGVGGASRATSTGTGGNFYRFELAWSADPDANSRLTLLREHAGEDAQGLAELFRESLSAETLASLVATLDAGHDDPYAAKVLRALPATKRFEVSVGLLGDEERAILDKLLKRVAPDMASRYA